MALGVHTYDEQSAKPSISIWTFLRFSPLGITNSHMHVVVTEGVNQCPVE